MAEHVLGLLLVTQSSRGRNVFRYPPDPFSPHTRLSQPIYPSATFTAKETAFRNDKPATLFPPPEEPSKRNSIASSRPHDKLGKAWMHPWTSADGDVRELHDGMDQSDSDDASSVSSDNDLGLHEPGPAQGRAEKGIRANSHGKHSDADSSRYTTSRRGSLPPDHPLGPFGLSSLTQSTMELAKPDLSEKFVENQYDHALSYTLDFLGDMLCPPRSACNRKFEVTVDELLFIGHPITNGPDGKWAFPDEDEGIRPSARRRRRGREEKSNLDTVVEDHEGLSPAIEKDKMGGKTEPRKSDDGSAPPLNMFHLVVIVDRPDPKSVGNEHDVVANSFAEEIYREIAFKWAAAAFALQVKDNWIAQQTWEMQRIKERFMNEGKSRFWPEHNEDVTEPSPTDIRVLRGTIREMPIGQVT